MKKTASTGHQSVPPVQLMMSARQFAAVLFGIIFSVFALAASPANNITEISLERGCPGCPTGTVLVLRSDGGAILTRTGDERFATSNQTSKATITTRDFARLASLIEAKHFFQMKDDYGDPNLQDAAWSTLSVTRNGKSKKVMSRGDSAPPQFRAILDAIDTLEKRLFPAAQSSR